MGLKKKYKKKIVKGIEEFIISNYEKVDLIMGEGLFNNRCHHNSVQAVKEGWADEVYLCLCVSKEYYPIVHVINKTQGVFVDNTLGYRFSEYDYYIVREIREDEFYRVDNILGDKKRELIKLFSNPIACKLLNINEYNIGI